MEAEAKQMEVLRKHFCSEEQGGGFIHDKLTRSRPTESGERPSWVWVMLNNLSVKTAGNIHLCCKASRVVA